MTRFRNSFVVPANAGTQRLLTQDTGFPAFSRARVYVRLSVGRTDRAATRLRHLASPAALTAAFAE